MIGRPGILSSSPEWKNILILKKLNKKSKAKYNWKRTPKYPIRANSNPHRIGT